MNFKYRIENNEVIITGYSDLSSTEINIPEFDFLENTEKSCSI